MRLRKDRQRIDKVRSRSFCRESRRPTDATPVSHDPAITTVFDAQESMPATPERSTRDFARFLGRTLVFVSILLFLLSGYVAFADYWIQTQWTKAEATVLSGEIRQSSSGSTNRPGTAGSYSKMYYFYCVVSYPVAGEIRQSDLNSPASAYRIDAQGWASKWSPNQHISILYKSSDLGRIRLAYNPTEITATGTLRVAFCFLAPGILLILISRSDRNS